MIREAVRPGGLVVYQTRTVRWLEREPDASLLYLLESDELRKKKTSATQLWRDGRSFPDTGSMRQLFHVKHRGPNLPFPGP